MVGIVGILLLGSLAWSAVGALFNALGDAGALVGAARATPVRLTSSAVATPTATPLLVVVGVGATSVPLPGVTPPPAVATSTPGLAATPTPAPAVATATPEIAGRAPWILLPQPAPGARVAPGSMTIEARGRGDAAITSIRLELDGAPLPVAIEQRSESTWRGFATTQVTPGQHAVRATVIDDQGRTGGYRWTFEAAP